MLLGPRYPGRMCLIHGRPVFLLRILFKLFDKVVYSRLLEFLQTFEILYRHQFDFGKKYSPRMALMILMDTTTKSIGNVGFIIWVFIALTKVFDTVNHDTWLHELSHYGIRGSPLKWFKNYLEGGGLNTLCIMLLYLQKWCSHVDFEFFCKHNIPLLYSDDTNLPKNGKKRNKTLRCN